MAFFDFLKRKKTPAPPPRAAAPRTVAPVVWPPVVAPMAEPSRQSVPVEETPPPATVPQPLGATDVVAEASPLRPASTEPPAFELADPEATPDEPDRDGPERRERIRRKARPGTRVLVIDDSPTIVALLKRMLQQNELTVLEAFDAETGIEIARREVPDMIFLDIVLPGMDGFRALRTLRRDPITKDLPIIMISGNAQATEQFYVQRIGADDFMKKPFSRAEVFNRLEALLDEEGIPRHTVKPGTRAEAAAAST